VETFANVLQTPAPVTGFVSRRYGTDDARSPLEEDDLSEVEGTVPRTIEAWARAQKLDDTFDLLVRTIEDAALKDELWIQALPGRTPTIIVPPACQELLVRDAHERMHHLNHAKVFALLKQSYLFPDMKRWIRKWLEDCPDCELAKARQNTAHALFHSTPVHAPRARWCMDFQGQGTATTGETELLALIDWHAAGQTDIILAWECPEDIKEQRLLFIDYTGEINLKDVHTVLVARGLEFTIVGKLRFRSLRLLAPVHDQLFRFAK
jgi:hypothetical protein